MRVGLRDKRSNQSRELPAFAGTTKCASATITEKNWIPSDTGMTKNDIYAGKTDRTEKLNSVPARRIVHMHVPEPKIRQMRERDERAADRDEHRM
jgi:hypothetical protein